MTAKAQTAWAYLVVSDPQQADSLADQEAWARETARAHGWAIIRVISGVSSGKLGARTLATKMIEDLERLAPEQVPDRILMIRLERLGRGNGLEAMEAFLRIRRLQIVVHTRIDGDVSYERASNLLMPVLRFFIGGMENEVRRDKLLTMYARLREARKSDRTIAVSMRAPYGLTYEDGHFVEKPHEGAAVRLAYSLKLQGYGPHLIAKRLIEVAAPMVLKNGAPRPQRWTADRVRKLLLKETYCGTIVDAETWARAQLPLRVVARPTIRYEYPLGGALRCECGYALRGCKGTGKKSSPFRYYQCANFQTHGRMKHHRSNLLEDQFVALLRRLEADEGLLRSFITHRGNASNAEMIGSQLSALKLEYSRLDERRRAVFSAFEDGTLLKEDLQWRLDDLKTRAGEIETQTRALETEALACKVQAVRIEDVRSLIKSASATWLAAAIDDRRALARAVANAFGGLVVTLDGTLRVETGRSSTNMA